MHCPLPVGFMCIFVDFSYKKTKKPLGTRHSAMARHCRLLEAETYGSNPHMKPHCVLPLLLLWLLSAILLFLLPFMTSSDDDVRFESGVGPGVREERVEGHHFKLGRWEEV